MDSYLSLYEVISVTPGEGLRLKDLMTGEEMDVLDVRASMNVVKWDILVARVIRMGNVNKLSGMVTLLPRKMKESALSSIKQVWERFRKETGNPQWSYFMKSNAHLVHHLIEDQPLKEPVFVTEEYHRICSAKALFEVKDIDWVRYRLGQEFDFLLEEEEGDKITFTWLKRGASKHLEIGSPPEGAIILKSEMVGGKGRLRWTSLGTVTLTPKRLELWCLSKERLQQGKKRLFEILEDGIQHRIDTYEDVLKGSMGNLEEPPPVEREEIAEKFLPVFEKTMEAFVTKWIDEKIPALGGKTPREAVKTSEGREKVEELLRDWENLEERKRKAGEPYIDLNILRQMLDLKI
ncbi:MAG: MbcA/ParS/Xre antitoxin family protein [Thermodesulfobacteriota bacterium]